MIVNVIKKKMIEANSIRADLRGFLFRSKTAVITQNSASVNKQTNKPISKYVNESLKLKNFFGNIPVWCYSCDRYSE